MRTVNELIDQVKTNSGIKSDYRLAKTIGVTLNTMSNYRHGRSRPDDLVLSKLAELGGIPADQVELLAVTLQAERASTDEARALWQRIAARLQAGTVHSALLAVIMALGFISTPPNAGATVIERNTVSEGLYIMYSFMRRLFRVSARLALGKLTSPQQHRGSHVSCAWSAAPDFAIAG